MQDATGEWTERTTSLKLQEAKNEDFYNEKQRERDAHFRLVFLLLPLVHPFLRKKKTQSKSVTANQQGTNIIIKVSLKTHLRTAVVLLNF